jgi:hypothetical protein
MCIRDRCEEEETAKEHSKCDSAQCQDKVPPAPVVCLGTCFNAFTREVWNESPGKHTKRVLALTLTWNCRLETNLAIKVPTDHHVARPLKMLLELGGKHSKKTAASTGRFPPTPRPKQAYNAHVLVYKLINTSQKTFEITYPTQLGPPPAARPNVPQMQRVMLKAGRLPIASEAIPQKEAPIIRPTKREHVANRDSFSETPNSLAIGVSVRATPCVLLAYNFGLLETIQVVPAARD